MEADITTPLYDEEYYKELFSFLEQYNDDYFPEVEAKTEFTHPALDITSKVMITMNIVLGCLSLVIFLTVFSSKARSASASWYVYSLALETVILSLIFTPTAHSESFETNIYEICRLEDTRKSLGLLRAINIVLINFEVTFSILFPWTRWIKTVFNRFLVALCTTWVVAFVFADMILPSLQDSMCFDHHVATRIVIHILVYLLPGLIVLGLTISSIIFYSKSSFLRLTESSRTNQYLEERKRAHEWFLFIIVMNAQFLLLDLLFVEVVNNLDHYHNIFTILYLTVVHELLRLMLPLTLLIIFNVRSALWEALKKPWRLIVYCQKEGTADEEVLTMSGVAEQCV